MSERDLLDEAFAALREETTASKDASLAASTRRALLVAAAKQRRQATIARYLLPIAAVLAVTTAWAASSGRLGRWLGQETQRTAPPAPEQASAQPVPATTTWTVDAGRAPSENDPSPPTPPQPADAREVRLPPTRSAAPIGSARSDSRPALDPEEALYRPAHEAHFVKRDWPRALAAWDTYLAAHPTGRFAPEARYNRALALLRLGRRDEAKSGLRPFAEGRFDGYRQKEAKQLLDAME